MRISPLDVGNRRFPKKWRGYDQREVDLFLETLSQELEEIIQENHFLSEELKRKSSELSVYKENETVLKETMITAQKVADDMRNNMVKEAQVILAQAELEGDQIICHAHERVMQLQQEIQGLKEDRIRMREELRATLRTYNSLLEVDETRTKVEDAAAIENNLRLMVHRKRVAE